MGVSHKIAVGAKTSGILSAEPLLRVQHAVNNQEDCENTNGKQLHEQPLDVIRYFKTALWFCILNVGVEHASSLEYRLDLVRPIQRELGNQREYLKPVCKTKAELV